MRKGSSQQAAFSEVDYFPFLQFNINELDSLLIASIRLLMKYVTGGLKVAKRYRILYCSTIFRAL